MRHIITSATDFAGAKMRDCDGDSDSDDDYDVVDVSDAESTSSSSCSVISLPASPPAVDVMVDESDESEANSTSESDVSATSSDSEDDDSDDDDKEQEEQEQDEDIVVPAVVAQPPPSVSDFVARFNKRLEDFKEALKEHQAGVVENENVNVVEPLQADEEIEVEKERVVIEEDSVAEQAVSASVVEEKRATILFEKASCAVCDAFPVGVVYHCVVCKEVALCAACHESHPEIHPLVKVRVEEFACPSITIDSLCPHFPADQTALRAAIVAAERKEAEEEAERRTQEILEASLCRKGVTFAEVVSSSSSDEGPEQQPQQPQQGAAEAAAAALGANKKKRAHRRRRAKQQEHLVEEPLAVIEKQEQEQDKKKKKRKEKKQPTTTITPTPTVAVPPPFVFAHPYPELPRTAAELAAISAPPVGWAEPPSVSQRAREEDLIRHIALTDPIPESQQPHHGVVVRPRPAVVLNPGLGERRWETRINRPAPVPTTGHAMRHHHVNEPFSHGATHLPRLSIGDVIVQQGLQRGRRDQNRRNCSTTPEPIAHVAVPSGLTAASNYAQGFPRGGIHGRKRWRALRMGDIKSVPDWWKQGREHAAVVLLQEMGFDAREPHVASLLRANDFDVNLVVAELLQ